MQVADDYVTEKVYHALRAGAVPVYLGAPNIAEHLPTPGCIINAAHFSSGQELGAHLLAVAANATLLATYRSWTRGDVARMLERRGCADTSWCQFCEVCAYHRARSLAARLANTTEASGPVPLPLGGNRKSPRWALGALAG